MSNANILIVEDEPAVRDMIAYAMNSAGFQVVATENAEAAMAEIDRELPDLILLDWMLPGLGGLEFARRLRRDEYTREVPIIMLTARGEESDRLSGFEAGVDDYIVKPFSPRELVARIKAVLRRFQPLGGVDRLEFGKLVLVPESHRVLVNDEPVKLGPTEYALLKYFMEHAERVYSRNQLLDNVWGRSTCVEERTVDVHILRLRKALREFGLDDYIQTVRGAGYRFSVPEPA